MTSIHDLHLNSTPTAGSAAAPSTDSTPSAGQLLETLIRTTHQLHLQFEAHLAAYDVPSYLTGPRLRFLVTVQEAGAIRMSDIAERLGIKPRTVTQFVDALEAEHMLIRQPDPDDRRATFVRVTKAAIPLIARARAGMSEAAEQVLAHLPQEQREQLHTILNRVSTIN
ncbi:MarR family winged helix-turn-helix transcriptional regulator [Paenibacillus koleovorans]|uniref:MarR family winged helix-turn-helix transcriptional regulator n=1 Tax=Paenibacillus koleovorans TaxID=121608 RepID=UPI000FD6D0CA|nr:MarR family transcriptional regulator [Paenibacillus koleovorans]